MEIYSQTYLIQSIINKLIKEEQEKIKNALRQKPKGYFEIEPAYRSFDGEFYTDVEVEPNQEKTSRTNANKKDPIIKPNGNNNLDLR